MLKWLHVASRAWQKLIGRGFCMRWGRRSEWYSRSKKKEIECKAPNHLLYSLQLCRWAGEGRRAEWAHYYPPSVATAPRYIECQQDGRNVLDQTCLQISSKPTIVHMGAANRVLRLSFDFADRKFYSGCRSRALRVTEASFAVLVWPSFCRARHRLVTVARGSEAKRSL